MSVAAAARSKGTGLITHTPYISKPHNPHQPTHLSLHGGPPVLLRCCSPLLLLPLPLARGEGGRDEGGLPRGCLLSAMDQA